MSIWRRNERKGPKKRPNPQIVEEEVREMPMPTTPGYPPKEPPIISRPEFFDEDPEEDPDDETFSRREFFGKRGHSNDPTDIVNTLLDGLKCQGVSAKEFCTYLGLHKNTVSRWRRGNPKCPEAFAFLFKRLIIDMQAGYKMRELLQKVYTFRV